MSPLGKAFARVLNAIDALMSAAVADVIERPEFGSGTGSKLAALSKVVPFLGPVLTKAMGRMWLTRPEGNAGRALAFVNASIEQARVRLDAAAPGAPRYEVARSLHSELFLNVFLQIVPSVLSGILGLVMLRELLAGRGVDREVATFAQGLDGNVTTEMRSAVRRYC